MSASKPPTIQPTLTVGQPGGKYEQEADCVAEQVMLMPEPKARTGESVYGGGRPGSIQQTCSRCEEEIRQQPVEEEGGTLWSKPQAAQVSPLIQRQIGAAEEEEEYKVVTLRPKPLAGGPIARVQMKLESTEEREAILQTKPAAERAPTLSVGLQRRISTIEGKGQPLPPSERAFFEPKFGVDFSRVRVHADRRAGETARAVNARAFTLGRDIVMGLSQYTPGSREGRRLLAHELNHVLQQGGARRVIQREEARPTPPTGQGAAILAQERRRYLQAAIAQLRQQRINFVHNTGGDLGTQLGHLRTTAENALRMARGLPESEADRTRASYRDAVMRLLRSRTQARRGTGGRAPTLPELFERHRDRILPFLLPQHRADPGAGELTTELTRPLPRGASPAERARHRAIRQTRQRLRVVTDVYAPNYRQYFDPRTAPTNVTRASTSARSAANIPAALRAGLENFGISMMDDPLSANTTILVALDLTPFGGGHHLYRFTRLDLGDRLGTELWVEREGAIGVEGLRSEQRAAMLRRFSGFGFRRSGFNQTEFDEVLIGLGEIPDAHLSSLSNLQFRRARGVHPTEPRAAGDYSQATHTIRLFDQAYSAGIVRLGSGARPLSRAAASVIHEVGHALDLSPLRRTAAASEAAEQALVRAFPAAGGGYQIPHPSDPARARFDPLNAALTTARAQEQAARSLSGARWGPGGAVIDTATRAPAFRAAAIRDGAVVPTQAAPAGRGFPTTYPDPESFWQEYFAEAYMLYQTAPNLLRRMRPNVFEYFQRTPMTPPTPQATP